MIYLRILSESGRLRGTHSPRPGKRFNTSPSHRRTVRRCNRQRPSSHFTAWSSYQPVKRSRYGGSPSHSVTKANARIFEEDRAVLEAQQQALDARGSEALRNLVIDAGSVWARRLIERMVAAEQGGAAEGG